MACGIENKTGCGGGGGGGEGGIVMKIALWDTVFSLEVAPCLLYRPFRWQLSIITFGPYDDIQGAGSTRTGLIRYVRLDQG